ncbi:serine hydrolase [Wenzhouxiangella sp. AB-CW3]|uniref:serine hydrolase domain-containing protein n=1 Tax=Wenzhouxiangella sp. AB-CW3 TaxID=2771012 RepID=UPI00168BF900|nr:serine hydrolase domain-containing protein [Wenzhouxiangella sp. AB-CW3]QOC22396.1 serine hydrolase [Wenzhouxiangella sp. AB-CW3]
MRRLSLTVVLLLSCCTAWAGTDIETLLAGHDESTPGVVIGLVRDGELVEIKVAGMADLRFGVPMEVGTPVNIGSTAKQFTGMAMALLHDRGQLSLDDDVRNHIPELPEFEHAVRLRHLLGHTSGYREFINAEALAGVRIEKSDWMDRDAVIATVRRQPELQNKPGEEWNYNNTGYGLLAEVITRVTGTPYQDWVRDEVFHPLGMYDTRFRLHADEIVTGAATGYTQADGGYREARDIGGALGAGGVYTTVADMARWMKHLGRFELGGDAVRNLMTTPLQLNSGDSSGYGLGLSIDEFRGLHRWEHGGGDIGHISVFDFFPELDAGYMIFANGPGIDADFIHGVAETWLGEDLVARDSGDKEIAEPDSVTEAAEFTDELFDRYAGRYELESIPGFVMHFFREGEKYMIQATGQPAFELEPAGVNVFTQDAVGARFVFDVEADGSVHALTLHQNGEHMAVRVKDETGHGAEELSAYAGRYLSLELETFYTIALTDSDQLELRHRRFNPVSLHHASDDRFNGSFPVASVEFVRDDDGRITGFKAGNVRARDILFERVE